MRLRRAFSDTRAKLARVAIVPPLGENIPDVVFVIRAEASLERPRQLLRIDRRIACLLGKLAQPKVTQPFGVAMLSEPLPALLLTHARDIGS